MFDERTGVLAHWEFLSFRELDQHSAAAYFSGVLIRTLLFMSFDLLPLFCFRCFCLFLYCMGTRALFHIPFFFFLSPLGGLHFRSLSSLYSYCGRSAALTQRLCFCRPFAFLISLIPLCFLLLSRSAYALIAPYTLGSSGMHLMRLSLPGWDLYGCGILSYFRP